MKKKKKKSIVIVVGRGKIGSGHEIYIDVIESRKVEKCCTFMTTQTYFTTS